MRSKAVIVVSAISFMVALAVVPVAHGMSFSPWAQAINVEEVPGTSEHFNTAALDGCPIQSPDGLSFYMASNRPRHEGDPRTDLDIWVARRESVKDPWGTPQNLGEPVNSTADDFCPTPVRGRGLFFVSRKVVSGVTCGQGDIYFTRHNPAQGWRTPEHLGCDAAGGPNTPLDEQGPSYVETDDGSFLFYSSGPDIYASPRGQNGAFGRGVAQADLNTGAADIQPNVRKDGLEVFFASNRIAEAGQDIWTSTRAGVNDPWSAPVNLGSAVNTPANETRPSLSWDGTTLYFGRATAQTPSDIFVTTRSRCQGKRRFSVTLPGARGGGRYVAVTVRVESRKARRTTGRRLRSARVDLRGLRPGTHRVTIAARTARGRTVRLVRLYRTCAGTGA